MNNNVKISVILPIYKEPLIFIKLSIDSILQQTFTQFELILVIDNPKLDDEVRNLINEYKHNDNRVKIVFNKENLGLAMSINEGVKISNGKYIARMDADDIAFNNRLQLQYDYCEKESVDILSSNISFIDEQGKIIRERIFVSLMPDKTMPYYCSLFHPTLFIRRDVLNDCGGYRNIRIGEDYELYLRILKSKVIKFAMLDIVLLFYRVRKNSLSHIKLYLSRKSTDFIIRMFKTKNNLISDDEYILKYDEYLNNIDYADGNLYEFSYNAIDQAISSRKIADKFFLIIKSLLKSPKWTIILLFEKVRNRLITILYNIRYLCAPNQL